MGDGGVAEFFAGGRGDEVPPFDDEDVGDAGGLKVVVRVEPEGLACAAADGLAEGGEAREVVERLVAGLHVVVVELLLVVEHDDQALGVTLAG